MNNSSSSLKKASVQHITSTFEPTISKITKDATAIISIIGTPPSAT